MEEIIILFSGKTDEAGGLRESLCFLRMDRDVKHLLRKHRDRLILGIHLNLEKLNGLSNYKKKKIKREKDKDFTKNKVTMKARSY